MKMTLIVCAKDVLYVVAFVFLPVCSRIALAELW